jgi:hypothetical protein
MYIYNVVYIGYMLYVYNRHDVTEILLRVALNTITITVNDVKMKIIPSF